MRCRSCCMLCRAKTSSVSQVGLDAATPAVLFSFMGGVSFPGVPAPVVRWSTNRRLHRLLFVYTPTDLTSRRVAECNLGTKLQCSVNEGKARELYYSNRTQL